MPTCTISVDQEAYTLMKSLKTKGESFSDVIKKHIQPSRPKTCGDLLEALEEFSGANLIDDKKMEKVQSGRGRRSPRRL